MAAACFFSVVDAMDGATVLATHRGEVVRANRIAIECYDDLETRVTRWVRWQRPKWVRMVPFTIGGERFLLITAWGFEAELSEASDTPWARRLGLKGRHAALALLYNQGKTEREAAEIMGLRLSTIRTYAKQLNKMLGTRSRAALCAKISHSLHIGMDDSSPLGLAE